MLQKELAHNRISGPFQDPPFSVFRSSPLGLVAKKTPGEFRLIHDLSYPEGDSVNSSIPDQYKHVQYESMDDLIALVLQAGPGSKISKCDIQGAYRNIPILPACYHILGFMVDDRYYFDRCLPMGCSVSCQIFERFSCALQWIMNTQFNCTTMWHLIDDFVFISPADPDLCDTYLDCFLSLCSDINVPIKQSKTCRSSTCQTVMGIEIDTVVMEARLPLDKINHAKTLVNSFLRRNKVTLHELQSLIGYLNFACLVVVPGRPFLRRLIHLTKGIRKRRHHIRLTRESKRDLEAWLIFLDHYQGKSMLLDYVWTSSAKIQMYTDAAQSVGYAGSIRITMDAWTMA